MSIILPHQESPSLKKDSEVSLKELSIVVPAVNTLAHLTGCLEAIAKQKMDVALEVLVVVNSLIGSTQIKIEKTATESSKVFSGNKQHQGLAHQRQD